jgi:hypothetical protein
MNLINNYKANYLYLLKTNSIYLINILLFTIIFSILAIYCTIDVIIISLACLIISFIIIKYLENLYKIKGLYICYLFVVFIKTAVLIVIFLFNGGDYFKTITAGGAVSGIKDAIVYHDNSIINSPDDITTRSITDKNIGYDYLLAMVIKLVNVSYYADRILLIVPNLFLGAFLSVITCLIGRYYKKGEQAKVAFWLLAFDPITIFFSITLLKDVLIACLLGVSFLAFKDIERINNFKSSLLFSICGLIFLTFSRLIVVPLFIFSILANYYKSITVKPGKALLSIIIIVAVVGVSSTIAFYKIRQIGISNINYLIYITEISNRTNATQGSQFIDKISYRPLKFLVTFIIANLTPFPYLNKELSINYQDHILIYLGAIYWHFMIPFLLLGIYYLYCNKNYLPIIYYLLIIVVLGLISSCHPRWRLMGIAPAYFIIASGIKSYKFHKIMPLVYYGTIICMSLLLSFTH